MLKSESLSLIDVGSGPGPMAAAFALRGAARIVLLDQSRSALDLAIRKIAAPDSLSGSPRIEAVPCDIREPDPSRIPIWGTASCVSFGHCLNELWADRPDRAILRANLVSRYAKALAPGGIVLVIEPALLGTSRDALAVRNLLVERGWTVAAPCPGRERLPCPALEAGPSHTCHETLDWEIPEETARLARSMGLDREQLKMTWFALVPPGPAPAPAPAPEPVQSALPACSLSKPDAALYRVVSDPMLNKGGRVRRLLCGKTGRFPLSARVRAEKGTLTEYGSFDSLERGDFVTVENPEIRENGWGMTEITLIERRFPVSRLNI